MFSKKKKAKVESKDNPIEVSSSAKQDEVDDIEVQAPEVLFVEDKDPSAKTASKTMKPSIISEGFEFIGEVRSQGDLTVDGTLRGTLSLNTVLVGAGGVLEGEVSCNRMSVKGNFSGRLECIDLIVGSEAVVDGNIAFQSITIQRGGVIKGMLLKK
mgnify:FL=1